MTFPITVAVTFRGEFSIKVVRFSSVRPTFVTPMDLNSLSHQDTSWSLCSAIHSSSL